MYTNYFGLSEKPFTITPDPRYLFMSERHSEALAHLLYGVNESDGFIQLTGEVGTGKTTLIRSLFLQLPENADIALILNPQLSAKEFLAAIGSELGIDDVSEDDSLKTLIDLLTEHLLAGHANGRRTILVVDEAQNLAVEVLEQVRMLTNLETSRQKLLQIILIGQPELRDLLARTDLRQLAQRITARYHLEPLSSDEVSRYIDHRLQVAGAIGELFTPRAKREIYRQSKGIPRLVNVLCDRSLLAAYVREERKVDPSLVREASREIAGVRRASEGVNWWLPGLAGVAALTVLAGVWALLQTTTTAPPPEPQATTTPLTIARAEADTPQTPAPVTTSAVTEDLADILRTHRDRTGTDTAFRALFTTWGQRYNGGDAPCEQAGSDYGLRCLYLRGSWGIVKQLDRPAILTLTDREGESHQVVLTAIRGNLAELAIGESRFEIPQRVVSEFWFGESLLLWRPPNGVAKAFVPGMRDPGILWLRNSLAIIQGVPVENADSERFDAALERRVRDYQRTRRLKVDGLVGQQTQIIMNSDLGLEGIPRLGGKGS